MALAYSPDTSIDSTRLAFLAAAVVLFAMLALYLVGFDQDVFENITDEFEKMLPGMMPILHSPGVITPGQFGPIRRDFDPSSARFTFIMSSTGMPSVMQTISSISASMASRMESAAKGGGT